MLEHIINLSAKNLNYLQIKNIYKIIILIILTFLSNEVVIY
jgi:hypothetical protein